MSWQSGNLNMVAFHDPKRYPSWDRIRPREARRAPREKMDAGQIMAVARMWNAAAGGTVRTH